MRACPLIRRVLSWSSQSMIRPLSSSLQVCCHVPRPPSPDNRSRCRFQKWFILGLEVTRTQIHRSLFSASALLASACACVFTHTPNISPFATPPRTCYIPEGGMSVHTSRRCVGATTGTEDSQVTHDDAHAHLGQEERHIESLRKPWRQLYQYACKMIKLIQSKTPLIGAILSAPGARTHAHALPC